MRLINSTKKCMNSTMGPIIFSTKRKKLSSSMQSKRTLTGHGERW